MGVRKIEVQCSRNIRNLSASSRLNNGIGCQMFAIVQISLTTHLHALADVSL